MKRIIFLLLPALCAAVALSACSGQAGSQADGEGGPIEIAASFTDGERLGYFEIDADGFLAALNTECGGRYGELTYRNPGEIQLYVDVDGDEVLSVYFTDGTASGEERLAGVIVDLELDRGRELAGHLIELFTPGQKDEVFEALYLDADSLDSAILYVGHVSYEVMAQEDSQRFWIVAVDE